LLTSDTRQRPIPSILAPALADLPAPDERRPDPEGRAVYANLLAVHRAEDTLLALADMLARVEQFLVPPVTRR